MADAEPARECVFCTRREQPAVLFETRSLYVMPDKFPVRPGHALIISKEHLACYAAAPEALAELDEAKGRVERFLRASYGQPAIYAMEHGVYGQTVFHAHLHVAPGPYVPLPPEYLAHPDVRSIDGWDAAVARYAERGQYRVVEYDGARYLVDGPSPSIALSRPWFARFTGMTWRPEGGWNKYTSEEDVREVERRWQAWTARERQEGQERSAVRVKGE